MAAKALPAVSLLGTQTGIVGEAHITELADSLCAAGIVEYLPLAVWVTIILFVVKESIEWFRKRAERSRNTGAIKLLLTEELERNHWAFVSMFGVLGALDKYPRTALTLRVARNGSERLSIKVKPEDERDSGGLPIPRFAMYERLLSTLAELDKALFEIVSTTYETVATLSYA